MSGGLVAVAWWGETSEEGCLRLNPRPSLSPVSGERSSGASGMDARRREGVGKYGVGGSGSE